MVENWKSRSTFRFAGVTWMIWVAWRRDKLATSDGLVVRTTPRFRLHCRPNNDQLDIIRDPLLAIKHLFAYLAVGKVDWPTWVSVLYWILLYIKPTDSKEIMNLICSQCGGEVHNYILLVKLLLLLLQGRESIFIIISWMLVAWLPIGQKLLHRSVIRPLRSRQLASYIKRTL